MSRSVKAGMARDSAKSQSHHSNSNINNDQIGKQELYVQVSFEFLNIILYD